MTWLNTVQQALGRTPMIYTGPSFRDKYMNDQFGTYPLWVAEYGVSTPHIPIGWSNWTFWQSTQAATVAGINGQVDSDVFAGSSNDLLAFIQGNGNGSSVGNTAIASAPSSNGSTGTSYTVQAGDMLSDIARQFNVSANQIATANNIANPNLISVGQVLTIPT